MTVLFNSFAQQEKGELPRHNPVRQNVRFPSTYAPGSAVARRPEGGVGRAVDNLGFSTGGTSDNGIGGEYPQLT
jgi:hypothetical protein